MHSIVTARDVTFELPNGRVLFQNINFTLDTKLTALVGPNGVGKTCLAKLISGESEPTLGSIRRSVQIGFFRQRESPPLVTVNEYLINDHEWSVLKEKLLYEIDRDQLCTQLSGGQWMRVRLAKAINDQYLILDEPTNDLDREGRAAVIDFLRECPNGIFLISHDRECLQLCTTIFELSNKGLEKFVGDWSAYQEKKEKEFKRLEADLEQATRHRDQTVSERNEKLTQQAKRNQRGAKLAERGGIPRILLGGMKRRAQVTTAKIDVATLDKANESMRAAFEAYQDLKLNPIMYAEISGSPVPNQKLIVETREFNIRYKDWLFKKDLTFLWRGNIRLALKGKNGSGKSSLLKAILNQSPAEFRGEIRRGNLKTLYIDQRGERLDDDLSVLENVRQNSLLDEGEVRNQLAQFLFTKETVFQKAASLSGGERLRASLAKGLLATEKPELLILDEPTNNLDLKNIEFLEELAREFKGALIVISHDEVFLENCNLNEVYNVDF